MFRFTIKTMLYVMTIAAALALVVRETKNGPTLAGIAGYLIYVCLLLWFAYSSYKAKMSIVEEESDREKHGK
jgi:hypothetical protein